MNEQILKLHALIQYLEANGFWGGAEAFRSILTQAIEEMELQDELYKFVA